MAELRYAGNPYTDIEAGNVRDGSVDYHDFDWGEAVYHPDETQTGGESCTICTESCTAPQQENDAEQAQDYEIVNE